MSRFSDDAWIDPDGYAWVTTVDTGRQTRFMEDHYRHAVHRLRRLLVHEHLLPPWVSAWSCVDAFGGASIHDSTPRSVTIRTERPVSRALPR